MTGSVHAQYVMNVCVKLKSHGLTIFRGKANPNMYEHIKTGKKVTEWELKRKRDRLINHITGDEFVMALNDLASEFKHKFVSQDMTGPLAWSHKHTCT